MEGQIAVTVRIDDRSQKTMASREEENYIRQAAILINERLDHYRKLGAADTQEAFSMVALDCAVARLKGDDQVSKLQAVVYQNIDHLKSILNPSAESNQ